MTPYLPHGAEIAELIARLREEVKGREAEPDQFSEDVTADMRQAADAIEALAARIVPEGSRTETISRDRLKHIAIVPKSADMAEISEMAAMLYSEGVRTLADSPAANVPPQVNEAVTVKPTTDFDEEDAVERMLGAVAYPFPAVGVSFGGGIDAWRDIFRSALRLAASPSPGTATAGASEPVAWRGATEDIATMPKDDAAVAINFRTAAEIEQERLSSKASSDQSRVERLETALKPFASFAKWVDEAGWVSNIHRESISTWFGSSDFRAAAQALGDRS